MGLVDRAAHGIGDAERRAIAALAAGDHGDPFAILGMHRARDRRSMIVRAFIPGAHSVEAVEQTGRITPVALALVHSDGFFRGVFPGCREPFRYRLRVTTPAGAREIDDPYRFPPILMEADLLSFVRGERIRAADLLGARRQTVDGIDGTLFAVWAPNARRVSVVGSFNEWDGRRHPMRRRPEAGIWEIFIPGIEEGALYKYEIRGQSGELLPLKADPYGSAAEHPPATASKVEERPATGQTDVWRKRRAQLSAADAPMAIYEAHLGSWRRGPSGRYLRYDDLADQLVPYVVDMGFTHLELLPIAEHPFDGSWGYQPLGLFAPTSRFGAPREFRAFVDRCHEAGLGVLLDWVPGHFPSDPHGLMCFDGTHLYEHADARQSRHPDWDTLIYNFGRREVAAFLTSNALHWIEEFNVDGLRVDAVASMLYLDYSRRPGEWVPNAYGGRENLEAIAFLRCLNETVAAEHPGAITVAEESTAWPMVSRPTSVGGLGFSYKWNMGWMHDTLKYMSRDPVHRKYHHDELTFGLLYAHHENFILPLSHDEVVHGKGSLLGRMPGDRWQQFANLRAYYAFMYTQPGKKLLFMGGEFAQAAEWDHDRGLDWHLLDEPEHHGVQALVRDLNRLYRTRPALHEGDCSSQGFAWIDCSDCEQSVLSYIRRSRDPSACVVVVCNFTPVVRHAYRIGVPRPGHYRELLNTDATIYGGSNVGNLGGLEAAPLAHHGYPWSLSLTLPPLGVLVLELGSGP